MINLDDLEFIDLVNETETQEQQVAAGMSATGLAVLSVSEISFNGVRYQTRVLTATIIEKVARYNYFVAMARRDGKIYKDLLQFKRKEKK